MENGKNFTEAMADVAKGNETVEWACGMPQIFAGRILEVFLSGSKVQSGNLRGTDCRLFFLR